MNMYGNGRTVANVAVDITVACVDQAGQRHELDTVLGYRRNDPYAVTMTFVTGEGDLVWTFGRELLIQGLTMPTGEGDVHVAPAVGHDGHAALSIEVSSPDGHLALEARADAVSEFLTRSLAVVAEGDESSYLELDHVITELLASCWPSPSQQVNFGAAPPNWHEAPHRRCPRG